VRIAVGWQSILVQYACFQVCASVPRIVRAAWLARDVWLQVVHSTGECIVCGTCFAAILSGAMAARQERTMRAYLAGASVPLLRWPRARGLFASFLACVVQCQFLIVCTRSLL